jgi:membrane fusion protein, multidrug efflux system
MPAPTGTYPKHPASLLILALCTLLWNGCTSKGTTTAAAGKKGDGGVPVAVTKVLEKDVPVDIQVVGNVEAYSTITVKAQVGGQLTKVSFNEGDYVKAGDLLFSIDPRPLEAQVSMSEANLAQNSAMLSQAQANLARDIAQEKYAQSNAERYARLWQQGIISKDQYEQVRTSADATSAVVAADKAAIESARAASVATKASVDNMKVQLDYTQIRSPIDGRTGNLMVKQGNVVNANSMDMMTINQVQPIYVTFAVPESQLPSIKQYMADGKLPVIASPQDDTAAKETGVLTFVDNGVDPTTGTIKLKGTFVNADRKLWPGQFVRVVLRLTTRQGALVVPNEAIQTGQDGQYVFVVKPDRTVESRVVMTGARIGQELVVEKGLVAGETVVTEGQLRLAPGSRIQVREGRPGGAGKARPKA